MYTADGQPVPLAQVAKIEVVDGQTLIARENGRRRVTVRCDIVGRDQGGFVKEAQERFDAEIEPSVPPGYKVGWLGMFENLAAGAGSTSCLPHPDHGRRDLRACCWSRSARSARPRWCCCCRCRSPSSAGSLALYVRGMNLNVSTGVGFAALFGVADHERRADGPRRHRPAARGAWGCATAILQGAQDCLRPILMAALVAILGLLPASLATGLGSDVQRPLATVIVWGLFSSTVLTLFVVPVLYDLFAPRVAATAAGQRRAAEA